MRLYESTIPSGNVYKVELLLAQLGLSAERVALDILATPSQTRLPEFLAKNPNGRVPLLELDDGRYLPESNAILCYLAEGTRFLPSDRSSERRTRSLIRSLRPRASSSVRRSRSDAGSAGFGGSPGPSSTPSIASS